MNTRRRETRFRPFLHLALGAVCVLGSTAQPIWAQGAAAGVASGDLPAGVTVLDDLSPYTGAIDEGRGMMEIIHDVAPGASQTFHTAFEGQVSFAQGIIDLANAGATVINDDVIHFTEPFYQDGIIAQAVNIIKGDGGGLFECRR